MKFITAFSFNALFALAFVAAAAISPQDVQEKSAAPQVSPEKEWLKQLVGEWDVKFKMYMQPDQPPAEAKGTDTVRALGDHWIVAETKTTMMGAPIGGVLSVGYNAQKKRFNATWIDSMSGYLWVYDGTLNEAGDMLTLTTEGPSMESPDKTARYKEVITIKDKDHRTFSSQIQRTDGEWMTILTAEYQRKK